MKIKKIAKLFSVFALCGLLSVPIFRGSDNKATQVKAEASLITDLTDVIWTPGSFILPDLGAQYDRVFYVNFDCVWNDTETSYSTMRFGYNRGYALWFGNEKYWDDDSSWLLCDYLVFRGGQDATNQTLISWLYSNGGISVVETPDFVTIQYETEFYRNLELNDIIISVNVVDHNFSKVAIYNNSQLLFNRHVNDLLVFNYDGGYENIHLHEEGNATNVPLEDYLSFYITDKESPFLFNFTEPDYSESEPYLVGYNDGYNNGYNVGYADGITDNQVQGNVASQIFSGILEVALVPVNFFLAILNFEVFGINISAFVTGIITVVLTIIVIKTVTGKGGD